MDWEVIKHAKKRLIWIILNDFGPMCFAVPSGFGCPLRLIMTLRKLSTSHFQRRTPSIFSEPKKIFPLLLIATLIATKALSTYAFSFYRFFSDYWQHFFFFRLSRILMAAIFLLNRGFFSLPIENHFLAPKYPTCQSTLCISKGWDLINVTKILKYITNAMIT